MLTSVHQQGHSKSWPLLPLAGTGGISSSRLRAVCSGCSPDTLFFPCVRDGVFIVVLLHGLETILHQILPERGPPSQGP